MNNKGFKHWNRGVVHSQIRCTHFKSSKKSLNFFYFFGFFGFFLGCARILLSEQPLALTGCLNIVRLILREFELIKEQHHLNLPQWWQICCLNAHCHSVRLIRGHWSGVDWPSVCYREISWAMSSNRISLGGPRRFPLLISSERVNEASNLCHLWAADREIWKDWRPPAAAISLRSAGCDGHEVIESEK